MAETPKPDAERGRQEGREVVEQFAAPDAIREDFTRIILDTGSSIWSRPGIDPARRSLATISVLTALSRPEELAVHIGLGIKNGLTQEEICETILHCGMYAGFPAAVRAMEVARQVFDE
ncbi:carboxymuconolactone decarboxylase family protein [Myxococcota bacterium]|nr:carboxymuconolactone decarboxylase family protein [Myxococcota bacterium]